MKKVHVLLSTYNRERFLEEQLQNMATPKAYLIINICNIIEVLS